MGRVWIQKGRAYVYLYMYVERERERHIYVYDNQLGQARPGQAWPGHAWPDQAKPGQLCVAFEERHAYPTCDTKPEVSIMHIICKTTVLCPTMRGARSCSFPTQNHSFALRTGMGHTPAQRRHFMPRSAASFAAFKVITCLLASCESQDKHTMVLNV